MYLYPETDTNSGQEDGNTMPLVFEDDVEYTERRPNIDKGFYKLLQHIYGESPAPEAILYYIYSVLYAPAYRQTYAEFLKGDFRITY